MLDQFSSKPLFPPWGLAKIFSCYRLLWHLFPFFLLRLRKGFFPQPSAPYFPLFAIAHTSGGRPGTIFEMFLLLYSQNDAPFITRRFTKVLFSRVRSAITIFFFFVSADSKLCGYVSRAGYRAPRRQAARRGAPFFFPIMIPLFPIPVFCYSPFCPLPPRIRPPCSRRRRTVSPLAIFFRNGDRLQA